MASGTQPDPPFRCKGDVYLGFIEHIERHVPGGLAVALQGPMDDGLAAFATQRFLSGNWYDALYIGPLAEAAAEAAGTPYATMMSAFGTAQAERDIRGIYQHLLRLASPSMVVEHLPRVGRRYFDFVRSELVTRPARSPAELVVSGVPRELAPVYLLVTEPYVRRALTLAGAKEVAIAVSPFEDTAPVRGASTVRFTRRITWR